MRKDNMFSSSFVIISWSKISWNCYLPEQIYTLPKIVEVQIQKSAVEYLNAAKT